MRAVLPMLAFDLLLLLLLLVLLPLNPALAAHVTCSWRPGEGSPEKFGYRPFCDGTIDTQRNDKADYNCMSSGKSIKIAEWGKAGGAGVFEWLSPCGSNPGGYASREDGSCFADHWALCLGRGPKDCFYMAAGDDCQWPKFQHYHPAPLTVYLWYDSKLADGR